VHLPTSHNIQTQFNFGINFENKRGEIEIENGVLGFGIEVADCLFDEERRRKVRIKEGLK
jgi:hypothetical protein